MNYECPGTFTAHLRPLGSHFYPPQVIYAFVGTLTRYVLTYRDAGAVRAGPGVQAPPSEYQETAPNRTISKDSNRDP